MNEPRIQETKTQMARDDFCLYVCVCMEWEARLGRGDTHSLVANRRIMVGNIGTRWYAGIAPPTTTKRTHQE